ncbi:hypothetical protein C9J12_22690 [Photobacterium frigidiphilum]|uniref:Uncharacterized protein n=1 Tax=Photobacterium frigidiphilum TaxID=264736 RepID=A0A2T3J968_9GAMM|nr:hypothetical protein [Photobacterium frigidiphilum]PSU45377.1 hypothetical protein C9J12_22690 [Photobacterium frigidiphilum]
MYLPACSVPLINGDCPAGWAVQYIAEIAFTATDIKQLMAAGIAPLATAYVFKAIRKSIGD